MGIGNTPQQADLPKSRKGISCKIARCVPPCTACNFTSSLIPQQSLTNKSKRKTLQNGIVCNAPQPLFDRVMDIHSSPVSTSLISFAVALDIRKISSSRLSSCLRCVDLSISLLLDFSIILLLSLPLLWLDRKS